jgi:hypothetical protein
LTLTCPSATIDPVRSPAIARIVVVVLATWGAPMAVSLAIALHVSAHHHDHGIASASLALEHGHHHDVKVPPHRHDATTPTHESLPMPSPIHELDSVPLDRFSWSGDFSPLALDRAHSPPSIPTLPPLRL